TKGSGEGDCITEEAGWKPEGPPWDWTNRGPSLWYEARLGLTTGIGLNSSQGPGLALAEGGANFARHCVAFSAWPQSSSSRTTRAPASVSRDLLGAGIVASRAFRPS